jgi:hypothetical protein
VIAARRANALRQPAKVIGWDVPTDGRKAKIDSTKKPYKFVFQGMEHVKVMTRQELQERKVKT